MLSIPGLLVHVGPGPLADWAKHVAGLGAFSALHALTSAMSPSSSSSPLSSLSVGLGAQGDHQGVSPMWEALLERLTPAQRFGARRLAEAWEFGSGKDYKF